MLFFVKKNKMNICVCVCIPFAALREFLFHTHFQLDIF